MAEETSKFDKLKAQLATERDELKLRLHLMQADARDEWEELEGKWESLEAKLERAGDSVKESAGDVGAATEQLGKELAAAYKRLKKALD